jgi:hypothetical protein
LPATSLCVESGWIWVFASLTSRVIGHSGSAVAEAQRGAENTGVAVGLDAPVS